jgi:hypothetical protein
MEITNVEEMFEALANNKLDPKKSEDIRLVTKTIAEESSIEILTQYKAGYRDLLSKHGHSIILELLDNQIVFLVMVLLENNTKTELEDLMQYRIIIENCGKILCHETLESLSRQIYNGVQLCTDAKKLISLSRLPFAPDCDLVFKRFCKLTEDCIRESRIEDIIKLLAEANAKECNNISNHLAYLLDKKVLDNKLKDLPQWAQMLLGENTYSLLYNHKRR